MIKGFLKFLVRLTFSLGVLGLLILLLPRAITSLYASNRIYQEQFAPPEKLAIVFGAGLRRDGSPTPILGDRVRTAANLYFSGKVEKILMSGDNRFEYYNEPGAMRQYALSLGVPDDAIVLDYAGRRTYDTCYRARVIFGASEALLVTQKFHLPRALFLCNALGLKSYGIEANNNRYRKISILIWNLREQIATIGAFIDVYFSKPVPVLGKPEPLFAE
jgi:SanA protein